MTTATEPGIAPHQALRWLADNYEQAQSLRRECEERLRAVLQGRDATWAAEIDQVEREIDGETELLVRIDGEYMTVGDALKAIRRSGAINPVPMLSRSYRRYWSEERATYSDMMRAWKSHPAYDWLHRVKGIGATLGSKLLARLDATKAPYASSFWKYCGLATVPGERYKCAECGKVRGFPVGYDVSGKHKKLSGGGNCSGSLEKIAGPEDGVRVAQPKPKKGEKSSYDQYAKKVCYLIATSFLKSGGPYEEYYRRERAKVETEKPGWAEGRKHYKALRKTQKLFLSHLWQVWREAIDLPTPDPWAMAHGGHDAGQKIEPWDMVE